MAEKKWAGKYDSPEEMEKGLENLVHAFEDIKRESAQTKELAETLRTQNKVLEEVVTRLPQQPEQRQPDLDEVGVQKYIDARMNQVFKVLEKVPSLVQAEVSSLITPFSKANEAKMSYQGRNPDYDEPNIQRFLSSNPSINRTFQRLVGNPDTAESAYEYAHTLFKAQLAAQPKTTSVDAAAKQAAGSPKAAAGPTDIPGEDGDKEERLRGKARRVQNTMAPDDEMDFAKDFFNGSKLLEAVEAMRPDWAKD